MSASYEHEAADATSSCDTVAASGAAKSIPIGGCEEPPAAMPASGAAEAMPASGAAEAMRTPETAAVPATGSIPEGEPLSESPLISLAKIIRRGEPVVFVTGSGLSAPSGIPTFRGENGVWAKWVLDWGTRDAFLKDPRAWWNKFWLPAHVVAEPGSTIERQYEPSGGHSAMVEIAAARQTNVRVITRLLATAAL